MKKIFFNADDLGMGVKSDKEILSAVCCGYIQSASVSVVNGLGCDHFKRYLELERSLQLGLHINLTEGCPISEVKKVDSIVNAEGKFKPALHLLSVESDLSEEMLYAEMKNQFMRFKQLSAMQPNHLDSHQHYAYLSPVVFRAFLKLALSEDVKIRNPLPFINESRLQYFVESVRQRYGFMIPFSPRRRAKELREIFEDSKVEVRTADCLIEIPSLMNLEKYTHDLTSLEMVCHPHHSSDLSKIKLLIR
jgi:predicted glycoside hydrolase/deacetylase ChbG (UPF0249 family)